MINFEIAVKEHLEAHEAKIAVYALTLPLTYGRTDGLLWILHEKTLRCGSCCRCDGTDGVREDTSAQIWETKKETEINVEHVIVLNLGLWLISHITTGMDMALKKKYTKTQ